MNECNQCERYAVEELTHIVTCGYCHMGFCHAPDRGTMHPTFDISVWVRATKSEKIITRNFENIIRLNPGEQLEFWVNDHLIHTEAAE